MADRTQVGCLTHPLTRVVLTSNPAIALAENQVEPQRKRRTLRMRIEILPTQQG
jgi:hypothetical protein